MGSTGLVKFMSMRNGGSRGTLHWGRADEDGAPYRGNGAPMMRAEEMDDRLARVFDPFVRIFDLSDPADSAEYLNVMNKIYNRWAVQVYIKRVAFRNRKTGRLRMEIYLEWLMPYMEDGKPNHAQRPYFGRQND